MSRLLVTGANGFVGKALCAGLLRAGHETWGLVRSPKSCFPGVREWVLPGADFAGVEDTWAPDVRFDAIIHLAARVHVMRDATDDPLAAYRATNVDGMLRLVRATAGAGVRRFVFLSSVKALGEIEPGRPWREDDVSTPADPYGQSKLEAERELQRFCESPESGGMEWVVLRPPLVYGPGVRANFLRLMQAVDRGVPLPIGRAFAPRSLVSLDNLGDALMRCATDARAAGNVFHVTDGEDLGVNMLVGHLARLLDRPARRVGVPIALLRGLGTILGRRDEIDRLVSPLRLDSNKIANLLGWNPPVSLDAGLAATVAWYRARPGSP